MIPRAFAEDYTAPAAAFVDKINSVIIFPLITLMLGVAVLVFIWGGFQYLNHADDAQGRTEGQRHMLFGIIGIVVMLSAYALLGIVIRTLFGSSVTY